MRRTAGPIWPTRAKREKARRRDRHRALNRGSQGIGVYAVQRDIIAALTADNANRTEATMPTRKGATQ